MEGITFVVITDVGSITEDIREIISHANYLVIEANHDEEMLLSGPYPDYLKKRILSNTGHLSNKDCGEVLANHMSENLKHIWLCHLSKDNNHPDLAYKTVELRLKQAGIIVGKDVELCTLKRSMPTELYTFE